MFELLTNVKQPDKCMRERERDVVYTCTFAMLKSHKYFTDINFKSYVKISTWILLTFYWSMYCLYANTRIECTVINNDGYTEKIIMWDSCCTEIVLHEELYLGRWQISYTVKCMCTQWGYECTNTTFTSACSYNDCRLIVIFVIYMYLTLWIFCLLEDNI